LVDQKIFFNFCKIVSVFYIIIIKPFFIGVRRKLLDNRRSLSDHYWNLSDLHQITAIVFQTSVESFQKLSAVFCFTYFSYQPRVEKYFPVKIILLKNIFSTKNILCQNKHRLNCILNIVLLRVISTSFMKFKIFQKKKPND
jgi:hypothetical protein